METTQELKPYESLQEVFNKSYLGMKSQGWIKATTGDGGYAYENGAGLRCAIGHCLPKHSTLLECGSPVNRIAHSIERSSDTINLSEVQKQEFQTLFSKIDIKQLRELQICHDGYENDNVETNFINFATKYNLTIPE
jgi:hypothetical protein